MGIGDAAQWASVIVLTVVLWLQIRSSGKAQDLRDEKNAKERAVREATIKEKLKNIDEAIKSPETGLISLVHNIKADTNAIKNNCASVTAGFGARIDTLEKSAEPVAVVTKRRR